MNAPQHNQTQNTNYTAIVDAIYNCVNEHMLILINHMLVSADEKLIEKAEASNNEVEKEKLLSCTQVLCTENNNVRHQFFIHLNHSLSLKNTLETQDDLVEQDEMEEMVAITTMHSKAMNIYGNEVNHLEARLEYLEIMCDEIFDKEALDPKHICEVFQRTIENIDLAIEAKLIFYKLFDQEVCSKLGVMYKALNQIFIDNDIMSNIIMNTTKASEVEYIEENVSSRVATYYDPEENVQTDFVPRTKAEISRIVNEFMSGDMTITGDEIDLPESFLRAPTQKDLDGKNRYERKELVKALSHLQHKLTSREHNTKPITTKEIKRELLENIQNNTSDTSKKVNLLDERNIDFVGLMFDAISDDETVSDIMTELIKRLQIPLMKVAMSDTDLFSNDEHPARMLVNLLTTAGKGINTEKDRLFNKLENTVDKILNEYEDDLNVFEISVDTLNDIINTEKQLSITTEKHQQKKIIQDHARKVVTTQFKIVSKNKKIPTQVRPLVLKNWSTLMLNRYLRHGRNSAQWQQSVSLLKLLLKCLQPIQFNSQYKLLKESHQPLTDAVNDALYKTKQDKQSISNQISLLKEHFLNLIDSCGYEISTNNIEDTDVIDEVDDELLQTIQTQVSEAEQKISQLSSSTKPGVWYEIYTGEDKALRRLKLSIILNDAAQLIFVDRKGIKVIEKDAEEFAQELKDNRSRVIADHSTFDHALGQVMSSFT